MRIRRTPRVTMGRAAMALTACCMARLPRLVSDDDQGHGAALEVALLLQHRGDADPLLGQDAGDPLEHTGTVLHQHAQEVADLGLADVGEAHGLLAEDHVADGGGAPPPAAFGQLHEIGDHGAGRRHPAGPGAGEHLGAHGAAHDLDGVELVLDVGQLRVGGDHHRVHAGLDPPGGLPGDGEQLDDEAQLAGVLDVAGLDGLDPLAVDVGRRAPGVKGDAAEDDELGGGVGAAHVGRGIGLGVPGGLGLRQNLVVVPLAAGHAREDVVGRAVEDAVEALDMVGHEPVAQGADDGDPAGDAGLEEEIDVALGGQVEQLVAVLGDDGLVGGDHVLARFQGLPDPAAGPRRPGQLDHHLHPRIGDHLPGVAGQHPRGELHVPGLGGIAHGHPPHLEAGLAAAHGGGRLAQELHDTGADRAQADQPDTDGVAHGRTAPLAAEGLSRRGAKVRPSGPVV